MSVDFNGSEETIELILRTIVSVNQIIIFGAVADLCKELSKDSQVAGKLAANEDLESMEILSGLPIADPHTNAELQGNSIMPENCEGFISSTLRTRNCKRPLRMLARNWKHRWLLLCFARQARRVSTGRPVARPMRSNQNLRVSLEASESTRLRMEDSLPNSHEEHIAGKGDNSLQHYNLVHKIYSYAPSQEDTRSKSSSGYGMRET